MSPGLRGCQRRKNESQNIRSEMGLANSRGSRVIRNFALFCARRALIRNGFRNERVAVKCYVAIVER